MKNQKLEITLKGIPLEISYFLRPGKKETLLYLHGGACSKKDFAEAQHVESFDDYTLVSFDFPGCGYSPYPAEATFTIDDLVELTHQIIQELQLSSIVLISHSMGGLIALLLTEKYPKEIKAMISAEGNLSPDSCNFSRSIVGFGKEEWEQVEFPRFLEMLSKHEYIGHRKYGENAEKHSSARAFFDCCDQLVDYSDNGDLTQRFIDLELPKLYLYGSENRSMRHIAQLREAAVNIQEVFKSDHFPFYDNPEEYYRLIVSFLDALRK